MRVLLPLIFALVSAGVGAQPTVPIDELMKRSGIIVVLNSVPSVFVAALDTDMTRSRLSPATAASIRRALFAAYRPDRLLATVKRELEQAIPDTERVEAMAWFDSPLGRRINDVERQAASAVEPRSSAGNPDLPPARLALIERYVKATESDEAGELLVYSAGTALSVGIASATGQRIDWDQWRRNVEASRAEVVRGIHLTGVRVYARLYGSLSDDELARFVDFLESSAGRSLTHEMLRALRQALLEGAERIPAEFAASKS
jgi:hypothetical protein